MKGLIVFLILSVLSVVFFLIVYFGILKRSSSDDDDDDWSDTKTRLRLDHSPYSDPNRLNLVLDAGTHVTNKYALTVTHTKIDKLPGYSKYEFVTEYPFTTSTVFVGSVEVPTMEINFMNATLYEWQREPLFLIIYSTIPESNDGKMVSYFVRVQDDLKEFRKYKTKVDLHTDEEKICEFIRKTNVELYNVFPLEIGKVIEGEKVEIRRPNTKRVVNMTKGYDKFMPYISVTMDVSEPYGNFYFQLSEITHKGHVVDIIAPEELLYKVIVYHWNNKPLMIDLISFPDNHFYYRQTGDLEWTVMVNPEDEAISRRRLKPIEIKEILNSLNIEVNNTTNLDLTKFEKYFYDRKLILVENEEIKTESNTYVKYTHKMKDPKMQLVVGGYENNTTFYRNLPLGLTLEYMSVYTVNELPIMLEMKVVETEEEKKDKDREKENTSEEEGKGVKEDNEEGTQNGSNKDNGEEENGNSKAKEEGEDETKNISKENKNKNKSKKEIRYFFFNKMSEWEEFEVRSTDGSSTREGVGIDLGVELDTIAGYLGPIVVLDVGKKGPYDSNKSSIEGGSRKITVDFKEKEGYYFIYTHKPPTKDDGEEENGNSKAKKSQLYKQATISRVVFNGKEVKGILPTTVTQALVYLTEDDMAVAVDISTGFAKKAYINSGEYMWEDGYYNSDSKVALSTYSFEAYVKRHNKVVSFDVGNMYSTNSKELAAVLEHTERGPYIRYVHRLWMDETFILDELRYKGVKYSGFDLTPFFSHKFQSIRVYYTRDSFIPMLLVLYKFGREVYFYNDFDGNWLRLPMYHYDYFKLIKYLDVSLPMLNGVISIDNYVDYSSVHRTNQVKKLNVLGNKSNDVEEEIEKENENQNQIQAVGIEEIQDPEELDKERSGGRPKKGTGDRFTKVAVKVTKTDFSYHYTKCKHTLSALVNPVGIIYMGFIEGSLPFFKEVESVTVYFKKNIHIPLYLEVIALRRVMQYVNNGDGTWAEVTSSKPLLETLEGVVKVLSETETWKTAEEVPDERLVLDISVKKEEEEKKYNMN